MLILSMGRDVRWRRHTMRRERLKIAILSATIGLGGCSASHRFAVESQIVDKPIACCSIEGDSLPSRTSESESSPEDSPTIVRPPSHHRTLRLVSEKAERAEPAEPNTLDDRPASRERSDAASELPRPVIVRCAKTQLVELEDHSSKTARDYPQDGVIRLNLPTALSIVDGQHPAVGVAQWRVQEAYARLDRANTLWLPTIQAGVSYHNHDGNYQASNGEIVDVHRNSLQYGLGNGATGAGTTPQPGIVASFHLADAIFEPRIARTTAWARGHNASGVRNEQLLRVSIAYLNLLSASQRWSIVDDSATRTTALAKLTEDFAATGQGLRADAERLQTEQFLVQDRAAMAREQIDVASAELAEALSIDATVPIVPLDPMAVPIEMVDGEMTRATLIATGLANRPELKEARALVAAACEAYRREQYAPLVPSVLLGFSNGQFGGGLGNDPDDVDGRYDFDALMTWQIRNLGWGEAAARGESAARVQQRRFEKLRLLDQVARQVSEAHAQVMHRRERIAITRRAAESAESSYRRNLSRIREAQGLPLEVLQSVQALENARLAYVNAVIEHNQAELRLQWAIGWPIVADESSL